ncbi:hypothetical protein [Nonomuraea wenchangensis]|uniref:Uncharacterized protein n=1 Tax=Nonomuraea wenchangensis TaxID=568860 RepID=A0A1I0LU28_9ACTN|nr:hypothetical protein [Nonomuraea wenchangensis]SEU46698.1 hypothetical protein SAMN05421811_127123 [Nonomuraea wenchangensis]
MPNTPAQDDWLKDVIPSAPSEPAGPTPPDPAAAPPPATGPHETHDELDDADPDEPKVRPARRGPIAAIAHFYGMAAEDRAARRRRGNGTNWWMRWMSEQPTSVEAHLFYYLHERFARRDGRKGWDLDTHSPLVNFVFACFYRAYGLTIGLLFGCLLPYAFGWINQRPGRGLLAFVLIVASIWHP